MEIIAGEYVISDDKSKLDIKAVHKYLSEESYWSKGIPFEVISKAIDNSYSVGVYHENSQIGFARLVTDYATFAYLADVYILSEHRKKGLSKELMKFMLEQDWVRGLRNIMLATRDAHKLYEQFGFTPLPEPDVYMRINRKDIYNS